jgi:hypothetical protein
MAVEWTDCLGTGEAAGVATIKCLEPLFQNTVSALLALAGIGLFVMLLVGGFNFLFAGGDQKKLEHARGTLTGAITGLIIIVSAFLILRAIAEITGVSGITTFNVTVWP